MIVFTKPFVVAMSVLALIAGAFNFAIPAQATTTTALTVSPAAPYVVGLNAVPYSFSMTTINPISANPNGIISLDFMMVGSGSAWPTTNCNQSVTCSGFEVVIRDSNNQILSMPNSRYRSSKSVNTPALMYYLNNDPIPAGATITMTFAPNVLDMTSSGQVSMKTYDAGVNLDSSPSLIFSAGYPVTFNGNGATGGTMATQVSTGNRALTTNAFSRDGYTFAGWTATSGTQYANLALFNFNTASTMTARWTANTNVITFDATGGSSVSPGSFVTGSSTTLPSAPTKSGFVFDGWFTAATGGNLAGAAAANYSPTALAAITLYAQWSPEARTVSFDSNGGAGTMASQSSSSAANLRANGFNRAGYYFDGWNSAANGGGTNYANEANFTFASNTTLYAKWRAIPLTPTALVDIQVPVGQPIANAPVALVADGLKDQTGYTVTVHSTPQIIDQGTIWSGRLNTTVRIPSNLESGWHRLVIEGTAADGTPWVEETFFKVSASGTLLATTDTRPAELAMTGLNPNLITSSSLIGGALLILGAGFITLNVGLIRRAKRQKAN